VTTPPDGAASTSDWSVLVQMAWQAPALQVSPVAQSLLEVQAPQVAATHAWVAPH